MLRQLGSRASSTWCPIVVWWDDFELVKDSGTGSLSVEPAMHDYTPSITVALPSLRYVEMWTYCAPKKNLNCKPGRNEGFSEADTNESGRCRCAQDGVVWLSTVVHHATDERVCTIVMSHTFYLNYRR